MSDRCYTHKARSCRKCDTMQEHTIELTETEREAVNAAACGNCGERTAVLNLAARIKSEAVQEELTGALHPEFGTEWREPDGVIYRAVQEAVQAERERIALEIEAHARHVSRLAKEFRVLPDTSDYLADAARIARGES